MINGLGPPGAKDMRKIRLHSEPVYLFAIIVMALAVALTAAADFGVSMIVAPAYLISLKVTGLTFGQSEYIVQALLFAVFCILMKKLRLVYFISFGTTVLYGAVLDLWRLLIPALNPGVTAPGSMALWIRMVYFALGMVLTGFSVALCFRTYIYPQVYDFFVKGVSERYRLNIDRFKIIFDFSFLAAAVVMSFAFFGKFNGIGVGTVIMTCLNGPIIGLFGRIFDKRFELVPLFPKFEKLLGI